MERHQAAERPTVEQWVEPGGVRQSVVQNGDKVVPRVVVHVSVIALEVEAVLRKRAAILGHVIKTMSPGIGELAGEAMPLAHLQDSLQRVVVRVAVGFDLVDDAEVRESGEKTPSGLLCPGGRISSPSRLVDVRSSQQTMRGAAHIAHLQQES